MNQKKQHPTLVIENPDGTVIRIYQRLTEEYIKELMDKFMLAERCGKPERQAI